VRQSSVAVSSCLLRRASHPALSSVQKKKKTKSHPVSCSEHRSQILLADPSGPPRSSSLLGRSRFLLGAPADLLGFPPWDRRAAPASRAPPRRSSSAAPVSCSEPRQACWDRRPARPARESHRCRLLVRIPPISEAAEGCRKRLRLAGCRTHLSTAGDDESAQEAGDELSVLVPCATSPPKKQRAPPPWISSSRACVICPRRVSTRCGQVQYWLCAHTAQGAGCV